jgi:hypothetical protein
MKGKYRGNDSDLNFLLIMKLHKPLVQNVKNDNLCKF